MKVCSEAAQTGMDARRIWRFGQRDGRIPQAYSTVRRGIRPNATQQACPDLPPQQKLHE
jgi:hypothetical protein